MRRLRMRPLAAALILLLASAAGAEEDPDGWSVKWSNGTKISSNDGQHEIKLGGRGQFDFAGIVESPALEDAIGGNGTGVEVRRARLFMAGKLYDRVVFKSQFEFAGGGVTLKDVFVGLKDLGPVRLVRIGHMYEPFGLEQLTSTRFITFMERGLTSVFTPKRNFGLRLDGTAFDQRMTWAAGGYRETDDGGEGFSEAGRYDLTGRVTGMPLYADEGNMVIHLGADYSHKFHNDSELRYRARPEAHLAERYVDIAFSPTGITGDFITDVKSVDLVGAELAGVWGPFSVQTEYMRSWVRRNGADTLGFWGMYGYATWSITGETRPYVPHVGVFGRLKPNNNFDLSGNWGAWELAFRVSYIDLEDQDIFGGKMIDYTAGLNWYLFPNLRMMFNYIYSDPDSDGNTSSVGNAHVAQTRISFDF